MNRKFLKEIYYAGDVYTFLTWKYGVFVEVNHSISLAYYNNFRDALNYVYEYSEFMLGKHILKGTHGYEDKYVTDEELKGIGEIEDEKILEIINQRENNDNDIRYSIEDLEHLARDTCCKHYDFDKKECYIRR